MNDNLLTVTLVLFAFAVMQGCAPVGPATMNYDCDIVTIPACTGSPSSINVNTAAEDIGPKNYCAGPNETVVFKVTPMGGTKRSVAVVPKDPENIWMIGTNDPDANEFSIQTPAGTGYYGYTVLFESGHCIDPRITVE